MEKEAEILTYLGPSFRTDVGPATYIKILEDENLTPEMVRFLLCPLSRIYHGKISPEVLPDQRIAEGLFYEYTGLNSEKRTPEEITALLKEADRCTIDYEINFLDAALAKNQRLPEIVQEAINLEDVLSLAVSNSDPLVQFAARRKIVMSLMLGRAENGSEIDQKIIQILESIWMPNEAPQEISLFSIHDKSDHHCLGYSFDDKEWQIVEQPSQSTLHHEMKITQGTLVDGRKIMIWTREKTPFSILFKMAKKKSTQEIEDPIYIMLITHKGLGDHLLEVLTKTATSYDCKIYPKETNGCNNCRSSSFRSCQTIVNILDRQTGLKKSLEIQIFNPISFLNSFFDQRDGQAHYLYKGRGLKSAASVFYPEYVYPGIDLDLAQAIYEAKTKEEVFKDFHS